jgi:argininosuccinate lyase
MAKLWQINNQSKINPLVEEFTSADQVMLDQKLIPYDIRGSLAHAQMLEKIGILKASELKAIKKGLAQLLDDYHKGSFCIKVDEEDCHTAIENALVKLVGEAGKKLHTGRSRNDQVLVALKLYIKEKLIEVEKATEQLRDSLLMWAKKYEEMPMPGYSHMQKAMPSSVKLWVESYASVFKDDLELVKAVYKLADQNPLGSGAGFGVSLPLDKKLTAKLLGFSKVQKNSLACQHSRGKIELAVLQTLAQLMITLSKLAEDVLLYSTQEFGFFTVNGDLTTGSSMMPQKKNLDVMEIVRARVQVVLAFCQQVGGIAAGLPSGYNRDLQETKEPLMKGLEITIQSLKVCQLVIRGLKPNKEVLQQAMTDELYLIDEVNALVKKGVPFREAYRQVKESYEK